MDNWQEIFLKAPFVGPVLSEGVTRFGPLRALWVDDPTGCRENEFPECAPIAPPLDPTVFSESNNSSTQVLYCTGQPYEPAPLPCGQSRYSNSTIVSKSPVPTPGPTLPIVAESQIQALWQFYDSTEMASLQSRPKHNWFLDDDKLSNSNYCLFDGVSCDKNGFVITIDLGEKGLAGTLPASIGDLGRLRRLTARSNSIGGELPANVSALASRNNSLVVL